jgi:hypothetical protein
VRPACRGLPLALSRLGFVTGGDCVGLVGDLVELGLLGVDAGEVSAAGGQDAAGEQ